MRIAMPRGDIYYIEFTVIDEEPDKIMDIDFQEIFFTVKKKYSDQNFIIQKKLSTGGISKVDTGTYRIKINPEDTNNLPICKSNESYEFDIELIHENIIKSTVCGQFILTREVTWASNEG